MQENNSHPLIVRGPDNIIEIPKRLHSVDAIKDLTTKTRGRLSSENYTIQELGALLGKSDFINTTGSSSLNLINTIQTRHTILIQLLTNQRWKILCLIDMVEKGWSILETTPEGQIGIFHTGSRLPLSRISSQYLIPDNENVAIPDLIEKQKQQPDIIAWRDKNF